MNEPTALSPAEQRIEEIRAIRKRLFGGLADELQRLRELGNQIPPGVIVLREARPLVPLGYQLSQAGDTPGR